MSRKIDLSNFDFNEFGNEILDKVKSGQPLTGKGGVFTPLIKAFLEASLEGEMEAHLDECKAQEQQNRRNGHLKKTVKTESNSFELETPRDRLGSFEPEIVKKRQTVLNESLDNKVLALHGLGMSYEAIAGHLSETYDLEISTAKISLITDKLLPMITEWRNRPLEAVYPIVFLDAMFFKIREEGKVVSKTFYSVLAVKKDGTKDILPNLRNMALALKRWLVILVNTICCLTSDYKKYSKIFTHCL